MGSREEAAVISAGIRSGSIVDALQFATTLTDAKKATPSGHMANGYLPGGVVNHDDGDIICS